MWRWPNNGGTKVDQPKVTPIVTQMILEEFCELKQDSKRLKVLRKEILDLLESGATVEEGNLTAIIQRQQQRSLTRAMLIELIGSERVEELKSKIEPFEAISLWVAAKGCGGGGQQEITDGTVLRQSDMCKCQIANGMGKQTSGGFGQRRT